MSQSASAVGAGSSASPSVIGWQILSANGEAAADGSNGYFNPDVSFYAGTDVGLAVGANEHHTLGKKRKLLKPGLVDG